MPDLLLEIGCEEIPVGEQAKSAKQLPVSMERALKAQRLSWRDMDVFVTPRRIAVRVNGLADRQQDLSEQVLGPPWNVAFDKEGNPSKAAQGFARKVGLDVTALEKVETDKGVYVGCRKEERGRGAMEILPPVLEQVCAGLKFTKSMRWARQQTSFVRPIRWIVALFGDAVVPMTFAGVASGRATRGHRFMDPKPVELHDPANYESVLEKLHVLADAVRRRAAIAEGLEQVGAEILDRGWVLRKDDGLLAEVTGLVEWPVVVVGRFDESFLDVPEEVLVTAMKTHQRYFAVEDRQGRLAAAFVTVLGTDVRDRHVAIGGNERVLRARLADARFFWEEDLKVSLDVFADRLDAAMFQSKLGTMKEKSLRVSALAEQIAPVLGVDPAVARKAGLLCKADLMTQMVGEFPEVQGVMGREYARKQGLGDEVALAIWEHYLPRGAGDDLPKTAAGAVVSLADRLDTITGCFGAGLRPKGRGDPYALRRAALGLVAILLDRDVRVSLVELVGQAAALLPDAVRPEPTDVVAFILDRLRGLLSDSASGDVVRAVLLAGGDDICDLKRRVDAVVALQGKPVFGVLGTAFRRTINIFKQATGEVGELDPDRFETGEERHLWAELTRVSDLALGLLDQGRPTEALEVMAELAAAIDGFFDHVRVLDAGPELTKNRLALLQRVDALFRRVADFKVIAAE
ncbi:MAG: glycine--tRNA ligase subunit beta [Deltaproteobacteria bacterium]|nr:glycine--tRNA ligase subunit beta [Deltaproteobacteria bacterium]